MRTAERRRQRAPCSKQSGWLACAAAGRAACSAGEAEADGECERENGLEARAQLRRDQAEANCVSNARATSGVASGGAGARGAGSGRTTHSG